MSEREKQIAAIIGECVRIRRVAFTGHDVLVGIDEAARRIAALPQPITAETVRRVGQAIVSFWENGDRSLPDQAAWEAIAQSANVEVKYEG